MASDTRQRLYALLRETARAYLDANEAASSREDAVRMRHEVDCLLALGQAEGFSPVGAFQEHAAKAKRSGRVMVEGGGR